MSDGAQKQVVQRLEAALRRIKALYLLNGAAQCALRLLIIVSVLFLLDYALALPRQVRIVLDAVAVLYLGFAVFRLLVFPLTRPLTVADMALAVETRYPHVDGRLISAIELASVPEGGLMNQSPALIRAALDQAYGGVGAEPWHDLFATRRIRRAFFAAGAILLLVAAYSLWQPDIAGVGIRRVLGAAVEWPRRTTLFVLMDGEGAQYRLLGEPNPRGEQKVVVAEGASLPVQIGVEGRDPGEVEIVQEREPAEGLRGGVFVSEAVRRGEGDYRGRIRDIRAPLVFRARGGDDDGGGRRVFVEVTPLPVVRATRARYVYPDYLGLEPETRESAEIEAMEGTRVELEFMLTAPARESALGVATGGSEATFALSPDAGDPLVLRHAMTITATGTYRLDLWNEMGFQSLDVPVHSIICRTDEPPRIKVLAPARKEVDVVPGGVVPFIAAAEDDFGISRLGMQYKVAGAGIEEMIDFDAADLDGAFGDRTLAAHHVMDLATRQFPFEEGRRRLAVRDSVLYALFARDLQPSEDKGRTVTASYMIDVVSASEKIRLLTERQIRLRREIKSLLALQEEKRDKTAALLAETGGGAGQGAETAGQGAETAGQGAETAGQGAETAGQGAESAGDARDQSVLGLEMSQNQLTARFEEAAREFAFLFEEYLFNRFDGSAGAAVLLDRTLQLRRSAPVTDKFPPEFYRPLIQDLDAGVFGEMEVISRLLNMLGLSLAVSADLSPRAAERLAAATLAADGSDKAASLRQAQELQEEIANALRTLLDRIAEWEDFQELLQMMRDLVDDQENLNIRTREEIRK